MTCNMTGHQLCLTTNDDQNAPVTEDESEEQADIERQQVPGSEAQSFLMTLPQHQRVADSANDTCCGKCPSPGNGVTANPREGFDLT